ncbi:MAG: heat-inducible transcriptional repressor HrcA [Bacilli bacterium]
MLSQRQLVILQVIVDDFIRSAQPVGSRALSKKEQLAFSSATIRNEMADLEDFGFIEKTHTSSGRVPSAKGYRYYVDHLLAPKPLTAEEMGFIERRLRKNLYEKEKMLENCSTILSELTNYTAIVQEGTIQTPKLERMEIIPVTSEAVVAILVTNRGDVQHQVVQLPFGVVADDVQKAVRIINERMRGLALEDVKEQLRLEILRLMQTHVEDYDIMVELVRHLFGDLSKRQAFAAGQSKMLSQPEFQQVERIRPILSLMENKEELALMLPKVSVNDIEITIGTENAMQAMRDCSLITANCSVDGEQIGTLAVLGPMRMDYNRVLGILQGVKQAMNSLHEKN